VLLVCTHITHGILTVVYRSPQSPCNLCGIGLLLHVPWFQRSSCSDHVCIGSNPGVVVAGTLIRVHLCNFVANITGVFVDIGFMYKMVYSRAI
jgi:hypothetical protein